MADIAAGAPRVRGVASFRVAVAGGAVLVYLALYAYFIYAILTAESGAVADINSQLIYLASVIGGVLATYFAVTLGVRRNDPDVPNTPIQNLAMGNTVAGLPGGSPSSAMSVVLSAGFWAYALVGIATAAVVYFNPDAAPDIVKGTATAFVGYVIAVFSSAFAPPRT